MKKITRKLSSVDSVHSSVSTDSDLSPKKPNENTIYRRSSTLTANELSNARIIQSKLVYVINLPESVADEEILKRKDYFGQYGEIVKCVVNKNSQHIAYQAYLTYSTDEQASVCIKSCNKFILDGNELTLTFGTTKYCNYFLRGNPCPKAECLYLHQFAVQNNIVLRETMPHTKHIQPCNSIFDGLKVIVSPPVGNMKLPSARIIRDRACSEQIYESPVRNSNTSRFGFVVDGDEMVIPGPMKDLRKFSSPKDEFAEIPILMYNDLQHVFLKDKWVSDILEFQLGHEKVLVISKT